MGIFALSGSVGESVFHTYRKHNCTIPEQKHAPSFEQFKACPESIYTDKAPQYALQFGGEAYFFGGGTFLLGFDTEYLSTRISEIWW